MSDTYDKENHWYGWNGGECPLHPKTVVDVVLDCGEKFKACRPRDLYWKRVTPEERQIIAFRIVKLYREPRKPLEWWVTDCQDGKLWIHETKEDADMSIGKTRLVREVLEPSDDN